MLKHKIKASLTHLMISIGVVGAILTFVFLYWYPGMLAEVSGLTQIVLIMIGIDLALGPLLTFVIFKPKKPKLAFDLTMIGLFQVIALSYAIFTIYEGHPLYIAYATDRFVVVTANEVDPNEATHEEFKKSKLTGPSLVFAKKPDDLIEAEKILFSVLEGAPDIDKRPKLYEPIEENLDAVFSRSIDTKKLLAHKDTKKEFMKFIDKYGEEQNFVFLPLTGQGKDVIWALSKKTGKPVDIININPWYMAVNVK